MIKRLFFDEARFSLSRVGRYKIQQKLGIKPSYLQGHCGDVNAGDAEHWIGTAENTANPVTKAICDDIEPVPSPSLKNPPSPNPSRRS